MPISHTLSVVQATHGAAPVPQALTVVPAWQAPALTQPVQHTPPKHRPPAQGVVSWFGLSWQLPV